MKGASRPCLDCGRLTTASRCASCRKKRERAKSARRRDDPAVKIRGTAEWKRARAAALARDLHRCTYGTLLGERFFTGQCPVVSGLDVHHVIAIADGGAPYDLSNLRTLCNDHHGELEERGSGGALKGRPRGGDEGDPPDGGDGRGEDAGRDRPVRPGLA